MALERQHHVVHWAGLQAPRLPHGLSGLLWWKAPSLDGLNPFRQPYRRGQHSHRIVDQLSQLPRLSAFRGAGRAQAAEGRCHLLPVDRHGEEPWLHAQPLGELRQHRRSWRREPVLVLRDSAPAQHPPGHSWAADVCGQLCLGQAAQFPGLLQPPAVERRRAVVHVLGHARMLANLEPRLRQD